MKIKLKIWLPVAYLIFSIFLTVFALNSGCSVQSGVGVNHEANLCDHAFVLSVGPWIVTPLGILFLVMSPISNFVIAVINAALLYLMIHFIGKYLDYKRRKVINIDAV